MTIRLTTGITIFVLVLVGGCDALDIDRCLDRGGSWNAETKQCSTQEEEPGQGLDLLTVLVGNSKTFEGKRVKISGVVASSNLVCSQHDSEQCLYVKLDGVEIGAQVVVSGVLRTSGSGKARGRLDDVQNIDVL